MSAWNIYGASSLNESFSLIGLAKNQGFETAVDLGVGCYQVLPLPKYAVGVATAYGVNSTQVYSTCVE